MNKVYVINTAEITNVGNDTLPADIEQKGAKETTRNKVIEPQRIIRNNANKIIDTTSYPNEETNRSNNDNNRNKINDTSEIVENGVEILNSNVTNEGQEKTQLSLEEEELFSESQSREREEIFRQIILNRNANFSWFECIGFLFGTVIIGFLSTIPTCLIPAHNLIQFPEFWYEILIHSLLYNLIAYPFICEFASESLNLTYLVSKGNIAFVGLMGTTTFYTCLLATYYIWTQILDYQFPIPFLGFFLSTFFIPLNRLLIWFGFPQEWRQNPTLKRRMLFYCLQGFFMFTLHILYTIVMRKIRMTNVHHQPLIALGLPIMREMSIWIGTKIIRNCSNGDGKRARICFQYAMATSHTIILCYVVGSFATETTTWILVGVDFSINILLCLWIVWTRKRHPGNVQMQIDLLQDLAVYELVEFHSPLSFILVISVAFYGPNAEIFGNV